MQLLECHLLTEELPSEFGLVVNEAQLGKVGGLGGCGTRELIGRYLKRKIGTYRLRRSAFWGQVRSSS